MSEEMVLPGVTLFPLQHTTMLKLLIGTFTLEMPSVSMEIYSSNALFYESPEKCMQAFAWYDQKFGKDVNYEVIPSD